MKVPIAKDLKKKTFAKTATMSSVSDELISARLSSFKGVALIHSVAITRRFVYVQWTVGTENWGSSMKFSRSSSAAAASKRRSISISTDRMIVSIASTRRRRRNSGRACSILVAAQRARSRSRANAASISGLRTFIANSLPSGKVARCTCAIDAAAIGSGSKVLKSSSAGFLSSASIVCFATFPSNGGSRS